MFNPKLIIFDLNETLLDLGGMQESVGKALGGREDLLSLWFSTMLHYSLVETVSGSFRGFVEIGTGALLMVAQANGIALKEAEANEVLVESFESLLPYPDVVPALDSLAKHGYRLVCLTNSSKQTAELQLRRSGLSDYFDGHYSIEDVKKYKPHPVTYQSVLEDVGVQPSEALMVAAHAWDLMGAKRVGLQTAFVARPGKELYPLTAKPDVIVRDLPELVEILQKEQDR